MTICFVSLCLGLIATKSDTERNTHHPVAYPEVLLRLMSSSENERVNKMITATANTTQEITDQANSHTSELLSRYPDVQFSEALIASVTEVHVKLLEQKHTTDFYLRKLDAQRSENRKQTEVITEFLTSHIEENDDASVEELKELADSLDIELEKRVLVSFMVQVEYELTVPLGYDSNYIDENHFQFNVNWDGSSEIEADLNTCEMTEFNVYDAS